MRPCTGTMTNQRSEQGFTLLELPLFAALFALIIVTAGSLFNSAASQVKSNRVRLRAAAQHRRSLDTLADTLRDADVATLTGFDVDGKSSSPTFAQVTGALLDGRVYGETVQMRWRAAAGPVDGVPHPGAVYLVGPSGETLLADRVPEGCFEVRQDGSMLVIRVSTYYTTSDRRTTLVTGETAVTLRN